MIKDKLNNIKALMKEAEHIQYEIDNYQVKTTELVGDTTKDYRTGYPRIIKIEGHGSTSNATGKAKLISKLYEKKEKILELRIEIESWLDTVDDPEIRDIIRLRYVRGMTFEQIGEELGYTDRTVKAKFKKFWDNYKSIP